MVGALPVASKYALVSKVQRYTPGMSLWPTSSSCTSNRVVANEGGEHCERGACQETKDSLPEGICRQHWSRPIRSIQIVTERGQFSRQVKVLPNARQTQDSFSKHTDRYNPRTFVSPSETLHLTTSSRV
eukprot:3715629-Rhodomonas_salina.5